MSRLAILENTADYLYINNHFSAEVETKRWVQAFVTFTVGAAAIYGNTTVEEPFMFLSLLGTIFSFFFVMTLFELFTLREIELDVIHLEDRRSLRFFNIPLYKKKIRITQIGFMEPLKNFKGDSFQKITLHLKENKSIQLNGLNQQTQKAILKHYHHSNDYY